MFCTGLLSAVHRHKSSPDHLHTKTDLDSFLTHMVYHEGLSTVYCTSLNYGGFVCYDYLVQWHPIMDIECLSIFAVICSQIFHPLCM